MFQSHSASQSVISMSFGFLSLWLNYLLTQFNSHNCWMWTFLMIWKQKMLGYYSRASLTVIFFSWGTNKKREWARSRILSIKEETLGWERPGQILLSGECLLVAWKMLDCACLPESAFLFTHAQPLMSLDKGAKLCSLCICIYICTCICNFPSWISKSQLTSALFSSGGRKAWWSPCLFWQTGRISDLGRWKTSKQKNVSTK